MVGLLPKVNHRHVPVMALAVLKEKRKIVSSFPPLLPGFPSSYCGVCCLKCHKLAMMKTMKTMKIHQSPVLWEKNVLTNTLTSNCSCLNQFKSQVNGLMTDGRTPHLIL